ncbi:MAG: hypothetical protein Q9219_006195 [cf. Caloplaca sp. 3 TL-2023]
MPQIKLQVQLFTRPSIPTPRLEWTKSELPLHDKGTLVEHLTLAEAWFNKTLTYDDFLEIIEANNSWASGADSAEGLLDKLSSVRQRRTASLLQWHEHREKAAEKAIDHFKATETVESASNEIPTAAIDVTGLSGVDILKLCGVETPFGQQHERKLKEKLALVDTRDCDESDGWETEEEWSEQAGKRQSGRKGKDQKKKPRARRPKRYSSDDFDGYGELDSLDAFSEDNMFELACQGIKPWDDDAVGALMTLNGGF